jgi:uncharacterized protein (DUF58 family)
LAGVLVSLWAAAFYSGNNLLYLCGAMLMALVIASIWKGVQLLKSIPPLAGAFPASTQAGETFVLRSPLKAGRGLIGMVDLQWYHEQQGVELQLRLEESPLLMGRLRSERRGVLQLLRQQLTTTAPLGLWRLSCVREEPQKWAVLPKPVAWAENMVGGRAGHRSFEGDELRDLRNYVPGDALSRIHWRKAASELSNWSVKRFEQHESQAEELTLRVDLRLPKTVAEDSFESMLGRVWFWVDAHLSRGEKRLRIVLGQREFNLLLPDQMQEFILALASASPQLQPAAGDGGMLLSLVEGG